MNEQGKGTPIERAAYRLQAVLWLVAFAASTVLVAQNTRDVFGQYAHEGMTRDLTGELASLSATICFISFLFFATARQLRGME